MSGLFHKIDEATWKLVPQPIKTVIRRDAWIKLLLAYSIMIGAMIYRFVAKDKGVLFHSTSSLTGKNFDKYNQIKDSLFHVLIFLTPGLLAFAFNPPVRGASINSE